MGKQRRARHAGVPELQLAVDAAAATAAALRCVATANRSGGSAVQRWQSDPASASALREALAAAVQSAVAFTRLAERCRAVPGGVVRRPAGVTANAEPALPAGAAAPAGSSRTTRRAAQRRRQRQRSVAAAAAKPPQAAPSGAVSGVPERQPPAGGPRGAWAAAVAASPSAPRPATPGRPQSPPDAAMAEVHSAGAASAAAPAVVFGAGSGGSRPPQRGNAGSMKGRSQPAVAALWGSAAAAAAGGRGGRTGGRTAAQRPVGTTPAFRRDPFDRSDPFNVGVVYDSYNAQMRRFRKMERKLDGLSSGDVSEASEG
jgi:hypothetical protein